MTESDIFYRLNVSTFKNLISSQVVVMTAGRPEIPVHTCRIVCTHLNPVTKIIRKHVLWIGRPIDF